MTAVEFAALPLFAHASVPVPAQELPTTCTVVHAGRELSFTLGTVAIMKGETHSASLVPESCGGKSKRFDLEMALPAIAGLGKLGVTHEAQPIRGDVPTD